MRRLLISALPGDLRMAWLEGVRLEDYLVARAATGPRAGARYLGRIERRDPGLGAAFVALGTGTSGLLPLDELPKGATEGQAVAVEVARAPQAGKGPRLKTKGLMQPGADKADEGKIPRPIDCGADELESALREAERRGIEEIIVEDLASYRRAKAILERTGFSGALELFRPAADIPGGLYAAYELETRFAKLLEPEVVLPSGARLIIEPTQSLVAVDVDSAGSRLRGKAAQRALAINREAAEALAEELRLRALSGLIVVDFLSLQETPARKELERCLRQALSSDPAATRIFPLRPSGLLDMTRQRLRRPLHEVMGEPCGSLGCGWRLSAETCAFAALRQWWGMVPRERAKAWRLQVPAPVLGALQGPAGPALEALRQELGRPLDLAPREAYDRAGNYDWEILPA